jgi:protein-tyrosine-phosphatase
MLRAGDDRRDRERSLRHPAGRHECRDDREVPRGVVLMSERVHNVLFLCTGNSARSIIAETLLNALGRGRFRAYSAGSRPAGEVNPYVAEYLESVGLGTAAARSKSWDEFARPDAPRMDLVITVCDQAAGEACPVWPGTPAKAHWSAPDPAAHADQPEQVRATVRDVFHLMERRISLLLALPPETLDRRSLQSHAASIAEQTSPAGQPG